MNKLVFIIPVFVAACTVIPTTYSPELYNHAVELSVLTSNAVGACDTPQASVVAETLRIKADMIAKFTQYKSKDVHEVATEIDKQYTEFATAYHNTQPSAMYCKMKLQLLDQSSESLLEMLGDKPQ